MGWESGFKSGCYGEREGCCKWLGDVVERVHIRMDLVSKFWLPLRKSNPDVCVTHGLFILTDSLNPTHGFLSSFEAKGLPVGKKNMPRQSLSSHFGPSFPLQPLAEKGLSGKFKYECVGFQS